MDDYFIKPGYRVNLRPRNYRDSLEDSRTFQIPVYEHAAELVAGRRLHSVLDIGCGLGTKLVDIVGPHCQDITGIDRKRSIQKCRKLHPFGTWLVGDLEDPDYRLDRTFDLIIAADVIEHLLDPDRLLELARRSSHRETVIVMSTPERDLRRGADDSGPPENRGHVREWNAAEFEQYLRSRGLEILDASIVDLRPGLPTCQMVTCSFPGAPAGS